MKISKNRKKRFGTNRTLELLQRTNNRCGYCGVKLIAPTSHLITNPRTRDKFSGRLQTFDHIKPISLGGGKETNNLLPACKECNNIRGSYSQNYLRMRILFKRKHWPRFTADQYNFLVKRGIDLAMLDNCEFYYEKLDRERVEKTIQKVQMTQDPNC